MTQSLPLWSQLVWYGGLILGSGAALIGALTARLWSLFVERGALAMLGILFLAFSVGTVALLGPTVALGLLVAIGFSFACFARIRQINRDIRHILEGA